jgi:hypothetical protein
MEPNPANPPEDSAENDAAFSPAVVAHCTTLNEAQMVVSLLASFGIEANIDSENYLRMLGSMVPSLGGVRVQVRQLDVEAAMEILSETPEDPDVESQGE